MDQDNLGAAVVKVVQVGYKLDETVRSLPVVRMIIGYGLVVIFMTTAIRASEAHVQCLFVVASMVTLFVLEPIPYQSSCMLPLFLFPIARLLVAKKLFGVYMNDEILRSISSCLVGLIALKSPLSRRLCLYLLCVTGVHVGRVLVTIMVLVFLVSMAVDATMTTGILAGFVDPLIFEIYANNLRIRYATHLRSGPQGPDGSVTEVDFVFKDAGKHRPKVGGGALMNDTVQVTQADGEEPMFVLDSGGNIRELLLYVDRKEAPRRVLSGAASPLPQDLAQNPEVRREQVSDALRTFGVDLGKLGLKLEFDEAVKGGPSAATPASRGPFLPPSESEGKSALADQDQSNTDRKSEASERGKKGAKSKASGRATADRKSEKSAQESSVSKSKKGSNDDGTNQSVKKPEKDRTDVHDGKKPGSRQKQKDKETKNSVSGKAQTFKEHGETATGGGKDGAVEATSTSKSAASKTRKGKAEKEGHSGGARSPPAHLSAGATKSSNKNTTPEDSRTLQQHVQFSHVLYWDQTPSVASASRGDAEGGSTASPLFSREPTQCFYMTKQQQVYKKGHASGSASPRLPLDSSVARGSKNVVIGSSKRVSVDDEDDSGPSAGRSQSYEQPRFVQSSFSVSESKRHFVMDFSGCVPSSRRERSRRHKDAIKSKRKVLRRKRKSTDLTLKCIRSEDKPQAAVPDHRGDLVGVPSRNTRRQPREKPWVERVDESSMYNPFLATDVSFRLRHSLSKPGLLWKLGRFCAERGDSLRNLLLAGHQQVFATAETDQGAEPEASLNQLENKERVSLSSNVDWQEEADEDTKKSSRQAHKGRHEGDHEGDQSDVAPTAEDLVAQAAGASIEAGARAHESGLGGTQELEAIILEEKEKAKVLRTAGLLALTYGASFGTTAAYGASNANAFLTKYSIKNIDLPDVSLNFSTWLLVHVPFCLVLMIIAATIINFVHTKNYDIPETNDAPPSDVVIRDRLHIMGRMSYGEYIAAFLVAAALILLVLREPIFTKDGWGHILGLESEVTDASVGIVIGMLAFLFPADILPEAHQTQIIEWADMLKRLPWGVIFILGSASTITTAMEHNGVFRMLEERLLRLSVPPFYQQYLSMLAMGCVGELTTFKSRLVNFSRIGHKLSRKLRRDPHFFLLPVNVICQLSLILPSASPNNAMAFEMGSMTSLQMIVPGFITKALTTMLYMLIINYTVTPVDKSELLATTTVNETTGLEDGLGAADFAIDVAHVAFE